MSHRCGYFPPPLLGHCLIRKESGLRSHSHAPVSQLPKYGSKSAAIQPTQYWPTGHQGLESVGYATFENFPRVSSCAAPKLLDSLCRWSRQFSTVPGQSGAAAVPQLFIGRWPNSGPVGIEVKESKEGDTSETRLNIAVTSLGRKTFTHVVGERRSRRDCDSHRLCIQLRRIF